MQHPFEKRILIRGFHGVHPPSGRPFQKRGGQTGREPVIYKSPFQQYKINFYANITFILLYLYFNPH